MACRWSGAVLVGGRGVHGGIVGADGYNEKLGDGGGVPRYPRKRLWNAFHNQTGGVSGWWHPGAADDQKATWEPLTAWGAREPLKTAYITFWSPGGGDLA